MAFRRKKLNQKTGKVQIGTVLDIVELHEPIIRVKLEDGTIGQIKVSVLEVMRLDDKDGQGKAVFDININMASNWTPPEDQADE